MSIGYYGKLPSKGDFVSYQCPAPFKACWDDWLQAGMKASRDSLVDRWETAYDQAPLWRFCLGQGICGPAPLIGVLMPCQDKVGRRFPLTLIWPQKTDVTQQALLVEPFMTNMEEAALKALHPDDTIEQLRQRLRQIPLPDLPVGKGAGSSWLSTFFAGQQRLDWRHFNGLPPADAFADLLTLSGGRADV